MNKIFGNLHGSLDASVEYWVAKGIVQSNIRPNPCYLRIIKSESLHREILGTVHTPPNPALTNGRIQGSSVGWWSDVNRSIKMNAAKNLPEGRLEVRKNDKRGVEVLHNGFSLLAYLRFWNSFNKWGFSAMFWRCTSSHEDIVAPKNIVGDLKRGDVVTTWVLERANNWLLQGCC